MLLTRVRLHAAYQGACACVRVRACVSACVLHVCVHALLRVCVCGAHVYVCVLLLYNCVLF